MTKSQIIRRSLWASACAAIAGMSAVLGLGAVAAGPEYMRSLYIALVFSCGFALASVLLTAGIDADLSFRERGL